MFRFFIMLLPQLEGFYEMIYQTLIPNYTWFFYLYPSFLMRFQNFLKIFTSHSVKLSFIFYASQSESVASIENIVYVTENLTLSKHW